MAWNYRVVRFEEEGREPWLALHEVYYDENGRPNGWTKNPCSFGCDDDEGVDGIRKILVMALSDAFMREVLHVKNGEMVEETAKWGKVEDVLLEGSDD